MEEIATVYARALFEVAEDRDLIDQIHDELTQFADALSENRQLAVFFFSPYFSTEEKKDGLKKAVTGADPAFMNFLEALIERHRMPAIFRIKDRYQDMWEDERDLLPVELTSAIELDERHRRRASASGSVSRPSARSSSRARSIPTSSAASCCEWATSSSTHRSETDWNNFESKSRGR